MLVARSLVLGHEVRVHQVNRDGLVEKAVGGCSIKQQV
jgi:hypothetical protein